MIFAIIIVTCVFSIQGYNANEDRLSIQSLDFQEDPKGDLFRPAQTGCESVIHVHDVEHDKTMKCLSFSEWGNKSTVMCRERNKNLYDFTVFNHCETDQQIDLQDDQRNDQHEDENKSKDLYGGAKAYCCFQDIGVTNLIKYLLKIRNLAKQAYM